MMPAGRKFEFKDTEIAIALLKGGLDWQATVTVMDKIKWDTDGFEGSRDIRS